MNLEQIRVFVTRMCSAVKVRTEVTNVRDLTVLAMVVRTATQRAQDCFHHQQVFKSVNTKPTHDINHDVRTTTETMLWNKCKVQLIIVQM